MLSLASAKPHAVLVPFPAQGHVNPLMQLAKLLNSRGFYITFVNTEHNHRRLIRSKGPDSIKGTKDFRFETIPDGLPASDKDATQNVPALCDSTSKHCLIPFIELLKRLNSSPDVPPVTCIVSDGVMSFAMDAAQKLGIPEVQFWTTSACGFMAYLQFDELVKRGIVPFKDESFMHDGTLDMPIDWIPGMPNMKLRDIPSFIRITDMNDIMFNFLGGEAKKTLKASAVLINTFEELEPKILEQLKLICPTLYPGGPLNMLLNKHVPKGEIEIGSFRSSLWVEDTECLEWLDKQKPESVVYVNYGCVTVMSDQHLKEFAWGLANSKHPFLWIVRPDVVMGESAIFPPEFLEEVKGRGLIKSWCPQDVVLRHPSVGAFLSHCGWNSTSESIAGGVPLICWPFFAEQQTNCRYACVEWSMGMEVNHDVKREEIKELVKEMMEGEKGREMRENAQEWKRKAEEATDVGGSAYNYFNRFIKEALHFTGEIEWKSAN